MVIKHNKTIDNLSIIRQILIIFYYHTRIKWCLIILTKITEQKLCLAIVLMDPKGPLPLS